MVLSEALGPILSKAFTVFAAFWVFVLVALFFGVGALMSAHDRASRKRSAETSPKHH